MADTGEIGDRAGLPFTRETIEQTIAARFQHAAVCFSSRTALTGEGRSWTYDALNRSANRLAHAVQADAARDQGCIALLVKQAPEMVIAALAVLKAGRAYLGVHPDMPSAAQREILRDAAPGLLLTTETLAHRAREIAEGICPILVVDDTDGRSPDHNPELACRPGDPAIIFCTSGSTGKPRGVVKSQRAVMHRVWLSTQYDFIAPDDRQSLLTHCAYSASEADMFGALLQGATLCVHDISLRGLGAFRTWIDEERITLLHPPVALFRSLLDMTDGFGLFPSVRTVALAGDVVQPADLVRWRQRFSGSCNLLHRFSTTETALLTVATFDRNSDLDAGFVEAGRPVPDKSISLVDDSGRRVGSGETGELVVRSRYLSMGYWRRPGETAEVFEPASDDPGVVTCRTGDLARFLPDGALVFVSRQSHLAKIRGFRVDTREVESAVLALEDVSAAAVIVDRHRGEDRLWAFVVMRPAAPFDARRMRKHLREHFPAWKIPSRFACLDALPLTPNGKLDRQSLARIASGAKVVRDAGANR